MTAGFYCVGKNKRQIKLGWSKTMIRKITLSLLTFAALVSVLTYTHSASSSSSSQPIGAVLKTSNLVLPLTTTFAVIERTIRLRQTACTGASNDCSLRGAIIAANADLSADPVLINLQPATTYNLTLTNATQENAAATGDLDITTSLHSVTIVGGGSSGPNASIIDAAGLIRVAFETARSIPPDPASPSSYRTGDSERPSR